MYSKNITLNKGNENEQKALLRFGIRSIKFIEDSGVKLMDLMQQIETNYASSISLIILAGLSNGRNEQSYDIEDVYDYIDSVGLFAKEITDIVELFTSSVTVSTDTKSKAKPKKK